jgi:uncharacterized membrane protein YgaE (UPF0421/DUF939 family)
MPPKIRQVAKILNFEDLPRGKREALDAQNAIEFLEHEGELSGDEITALAIRISKHATKTTNTKKKRILRLMRAIRLVEKEFTTFNSAHQAHFNYLESISSKPLEIRQGLEEKWLFPHSRP